MRRLQRGRLLHERLLALKRQNGLRGRAGVGLVPGSICSVAMVTQVDDVSEVSGVFLRRQAVFTSRGLDPVNLQRRAAGERRESGCSYDGSGTVRKHESHSYGPPSTGVVGV